MNIDAKLIINNNEFDLEYQNDDIALDKTGATLITTALFTTDWWAQPDGGSRFEETATGVINNNTRQNVLAMLNEIKDNLPLDNLNFDVRLTTQNIHIKSTWIHKNKKTTLLIESP